MVSDICELLLAIVLIVCVTFCSVSKSKYKRDVEIRQMELLQECSEMEKERLMESVDYMKGVIKEMGIEINEKDD